MTTTLKFNNGPTFTFLAMATTQGFPLDTPVITEETLETNGVDGMRWRTVNKQYPPFEMRTIAEADNFTAAVALANSYRTAMLGSKLALLVTDVPARNFSRVHVGDCQPVARPGQIVGASAGASSLAHVVTSWMLTFTAFPQSSG